MAILNLCGCELGDTSEFNQTSGTVSVQSSVKRTGGYALRTNPTTTGTGFVQIRSAAAWNTTAVDAIALAATSYLSFYFRYATGTLPASGEDEPILDIQTGAAATKIELRITSGAALRVYLLGTTNVGTSSTTLTADTWYLVELRCGSSATVGNYDLRINGSSEVSGTGNTSATSAGIYRFGKTTDRGGNSVDFYFDDLIISDSAFVGAGAIEAMVPNASGTYSAWTSGTGSTFAEVDEVPNDGNTSYLLASATNQAHTFNLESTSTAGISGTLNGVKAVETISRNTGTNGTFQVRIRGGSTDVDSASLTSLSSFSARSQIITTDPNGGGAWTTSGLDALELGVEDVHATVRTRWTSGAVHVHFTAATSHTASGALVVPASVLAATGAVARTASGAAIVPASTLAATAAVARTATGALVGPGLDLAAALDVVAGGHTATGALLTAPVTLAAAAAVQRSATGALVIPAAVLAATGAVARTVAGVLVVPGVDLAATAARAVSLTGAGVVRAPTLAAAGAIVRTVAGTLILRVPVLAAVAAGEELTATGALVVPGLDLDAAGRVARTLAGGLLVPALDLDATAARAVHATGGLLVAPVTLAADIAALERLVSGLLGVPALVLASTIPVGVLQPVRLTDGALATLLTTAKGATALPTARSAAVRTGDREADPI